MKFATSYFYKIRFFKPNMIPISTAIWGPKWFKQGKGVWLDKNNVANGMYCKELAPGPSCEGLCRGKDNCKTGDPQTCSFLKVYKKQLDSIDIKDLIIGSEQAAKYVQSLNHFTEEPLIVWIVHEAYWNPCSERVVIQNYFTSHGIECEELNLN